MSITVMDVLDMTVMKGAVVLAGSSGLQRGVTSATVLDAPDGVKWLKGMEFAFTTTYSIKEFPDDLHTLVQELADRNVSALGVKLNRFILELPESMLQKADELGLPIISLPFEKAWIEFITPIMSEILNKRASQLLYSDGINRNFTDALLANASMDHIANLIFRYMGNPVTILLTFNETIIHIPEQATDQDDVSFLNDLFKSSSMDKEFIPFNFEIYRVHSNSSDYVIIPLYQKNELIGYIGIKELNRQVHDGDSDCLFHAKNAVSLKSLSIRAEQEIQKRSRRDLFNKLLHEEIRKENVGDIKQKAWEVGVLLGDVYCIAVGQMNHHNLHTIYEIADGISAHELVPMGSLVGIDNMNHIVLLLPYMVEDNCLNQIFNDAQSRYGSLQWAIGVSQPHEIHALTEAYNHAVEALYHGIQIAGYGRVQQYAEMGIYRLFSHPLLREEIDKYVEEWLGPISRYEKSSQTNLIETLRVFLEKGGNYRETAKVLYLHYNSVRYRIKSINNILNCDMDQSRVRLQLQVALLLLPLSKQENS
jgi:purine catabolism regulator